MESGLTGRRALVTGGASGIGHARPRAPRAGCRRRRRGRGQPEQSSGDGVGRRRSGRAVRRNPCRRIDRGRRDPHGRDCGRGPGRPRALRQQRSGTWHEPLVRLTPGRLEADDVDQRSASVYACRETGRLFAHQRRQRHRRDR